MVRRMDYPRHDIFLAIESEVEYLFRLNSCKHEPETVRWIETDFEEGQVFYDVGANVGAYSLIASRFHQGSVRVYAFEPSSPNYAQLCKNININNSQNIVPLPLALSDKTSIDTFNYSSLLPGGALHALGQPLDFRGDGFDPVHIQRVVAYRIDTLSTTSNCRPRTTSSWMSTVSN